jgi:Semialdehyde dehydrogenase, NAD binding domain
MRFTSCAVVAALFPSLLLVSSSHGVAAFGVSPYTASSSTRSASVVASPSAFLPSSARTTGRFIHRPKTLLSMSSSAGYQVGIVGATGAVGQEIRSVLENRSSEFPVATLRVFGSERSAGKTIETSKFGTVTIEPFSVSAARECDVVFLAVSGDFALEHARAMSEGENGCVVIDNSVREREGAQEESLFSRLGWLARSTCETVNVRLSSHVRIVPSPRI